MSLDNYFKKFITKVATEVVNNNRQLQTSKNNTGMAEVTEFDQDTGKLTLKMDNGTIISNIDPGSAPVGPGSYGILVAGKKLIS